MKHSLNEFIMIYFLEVRSFRTDINDSKKYMMNISSSNRKKDFIAWLMLITISDCHLDDLYFNSVLSSRTQLNRMTR